MAVIPATRLSGALLLSLAAAVPAGAQSRTIDYEAIRQTKQVTAIRID